MESRNRYEITKAETICAACECQPETHLVFYSCPIFENESICNECCYIGCLQPYVDKQFSKKLGREITKEEINKTCLECGRNYAKQDPLLSPEIFSGKKDSSK